MNTETVTARSMEELAKHSLARQEKGEAMQRMCEVLNIPKPEQFSPEEWILLELTDPYKKLCKKTAEARMGALMIPVLLRETTSAQRSWRELRLQQIKHYAGVTGSGLVTAVLEFSLNAATTAIEILVRAMDRAIGGVLVVFALTFLAGALIQTLKSNIAETPFSIDVALSIIGYSLWVGAIFAGFAAVVWCIQQYILRRQANGGETDD